MWKLNPSYKDGALNPKFSVSCGASKLNTETGSPARPTIIVEKLTVKLDAQQLNDC